MKIHFHNCRQQSATLFATVLNLFHKNCIEMRKFLAEIHMRLVYISRNNFAINCELQQFTGHGAHRPQSVLDSCTARLCKWRSSLDIDRCQWIRHLHSFTTANNILTPHGHRIAPRSVCQPKQLSIFVFCSIRMDMDQCIWDYNRLEVFNEPKLLFNYLNSFLSLVFNSNRRVCYSRSWMLRPH